MLVGFARNRIVWSNLTPTSVLRYCDESTTASPGQLLCCSATTKRGFTRTPSQLWKTSRKEKYQNPSVTVPVYNEIEPNNCITINYKFLRTHKNVGFALGGCKSFVRQTTARSVLSVVVAGTKTVDRMRRRRRRRRQLSTRTNRIATAPVRVLTPCSRFGGGRQLKSDRFRRRRHNNNNYNN